LGETKTNPKNTMTIDNTKAENFCALNTFLGANRGYQVLIATIGKNGNGGQFADCDDLIEAGIEGYEPMPFESEDLEQHCKDANGVGFSDPSLGDGKVTDYLAYDRHELDSEGYLTGEINRIYIDLVA